MKKHIIALLTLTTLTVADSYAGGAAFALLTGQNRKKAESLADLKKQRVCVGDIYHISYPKGQKDQKITSDAGDENIAIKCGNGACRIEFKTANTLGEFTLTQGGKTHSIMVHNCADDQAPKKAVKKKAATHNDMDAHKAAAKKKAHAKHDDAAAKKAAAKKPASKKKECAASDKNKDKKSCSSCSKKSSSY